MEKIVKFANRLSEAVLFNWPQEEVTKLAWEVAKECHDIIYKKEEK